MPSTRAPSAPLRSAPPFWAGWTTLSTTSWACPGPTLSLIHIYNQEFPKAAAYLEEGAFGPLADPVAPMGALISHCALIGALHQTLRKRLEELDLWTLYQQIELPLCPVLAEMEREGMLVDRGALIRFGEMLSQGIQGAQAAIFALAGEEFNINSTQQLGRILFDQLGLPPVKKTKTGYSTNADVLEKLRGQHPIIETILEMCIRDRVWIHRPAVRGHAGD